MANMNTHGSESESILEEYATPLQYGCADVHANSRGHISSGDVYEGAAFTTAIVR